MTKNLKKDMILHTIATQLVLNWRTRAFSGTHSSSLTCALRTMLLLLMMVVGVSGAWGQTDYSGVYYIASGGKGPQNGAVAYTYNSGTPENNYYLCPTEGWCYYAPVNDYTSTDNGKPFLTTNKCRDGVYNASKAVWTIEKAPNSTYYYIKQTLTGKYLLANGQINTTGNPDRVRVHVGVPDNPDMTYEEELAAFGLFDITPYPENNPQYLVIKAIGITDNTNTPHGGHINHKWLTVTNGNHPSLVGESGKTGGPTGYGNVAGIIGIYTQDDVSAPFYLEKATVDPPTITNNFDGTITITAETGATIYYTTDGTDPTTSTLTTGTTSVNVTLTGDVTTIKAIAKGSSDYFPSLMSEYSLPQYTSPTISFNSATSLVTITSEGSVYYNTGDGSQADPTTSSTEYSAPFTVSTATTVKAIATHAGYLTSDVATVSFSKVSTPIITLSDGKVQITCDTDGASIYYEIGNTAEGVSTPTTNSTPYSAPIDNAAGKYIKAIAVRDGWINSDIAASAQILFPCATPVIKKTSATTFTITCSFPTSGVTIYYTKGTNPADPTTSSTPYNGPVTFNISELPFTVKAIAVADDYENSGIATLEITEDLTLDTDDYYIIALDDDFKKFITMVNGSDYDKKYKITEDINATNTSAISTVFTGELMGVAKADGTFPIITGLTKPLFATTNGSATIKNVMLTNVNITTTSYSGTNVGALVGEAKGNTRIYNCGIIPEDQSKITRHYDEEENEVVIDGFTGNEIGGGSGSNVGSLVGKLTSDTNQSPRVINCFSYATLTGGGTLGGIVGNIGYNADESISQGEVANKAMVVNCMFYGDKSASCPAISPVYGGANGAMIKNDGDTGVNPYNYFRKNATFDNAYSTIDQYKRSWPAEEKNLTRFEYYRSILNSNRRLCTWWVGNTTGTAPTDDEVENTGIAKWVLDPSIAPYPILKKWGKYSSVINHDEEQVWNTGVTKTENGHTLNSPQWVNRSSAAPYQGKKLGTLSVTINPGNHAASHVTTKYDDFVITDIDTLNHDYGYYKIQLPYYNEVFGNPAGTTWDRKYGGNYQEYVVTGWEITVSGGSNSFSNYNFADRNCTEKDNYNDSHRIFAQGGYYYVPEGVSSISIKAHWGKAIYLANRNYSVDNVKLTPGGKGGYKSEKAFTPAGTIAGTINGGLVYDENATVKYTFQGQTVYNDWQDAIAAVETSTSNSNVYNQAIVLISNHQVKNGSTSVAGSSGNWRPFTIMSADFDFDNEPDYCFELQFRDDIDRPGIQPVRFDFLPVVELGLAVRHDNLAYAIGIFVPQGHFEITETALMHTTQFEWDTNKSGSTGKTRMDNNSPVILNGGEFEQLSVRYGNGNRTSYFLLGGNLWFHRFAPGFHPNLGTDNNPTIKLCPVNVIGGDFPEFYLSGLYRPDKDPYAQQGNPYCYTNGGHFGILAGAGYEKIDGDVTFKVDHSVIGEFYGGGINGAKPIGGKIDVTINNSYVDFYCGGPKVGVMNTTVTTKAEGTTFGAYFGAGNGGNSYYRQLQNDGDVNSSTIASWSADPYNYGIFNPVNSVEGLTSQYDDGSEDPTGYTPQQNKTRKVENKGYHAEYEFEVFNQSNGLVDEITKRGFIKWIQFGTTKTGTVTNTLEGCTINTNFYGGGNRGSVEGDVTSTLTDCEVKGSVYGAGYSASIPTFNIHDRTKVGTTDYPYPSIDPSGTLNEGKIGYYKDANDTSTDEFTKYKWTNDYPKKANGDEYDINDEEDATYMKKHPTFKGDDGQFYCYTWESLTGLGAVTGKATLNIEGTTTVAGSVYGGGEESNVAGNTEVNMTNGTVSGNVYGGGKGTGENSFTCDKAMVGTEEADNACQDPGSVDNINKGTKVTISNGTVGTLNGENLVVGTGNVYGGGEVGRVEWNTQVNIGVGTGNGPFAPTIYGSVFGAGKGLETHGYSALVRGNSTVTVQGNAKIGYNVYGGGEKSTVGRYWVKDIPATACTGETPPIAPTDLPTGMPYKQRKGGICSVTIQGNAEIGYNGAADDKGHVYGAGKGVNPHFVPSGQQGASQKMTNANVLVDFTAENGKTAEEAYLEFLQTLALVTNTNVTIDGSAKVRGSVFGGSESGFVQTNTNVTIQGSDCEIGTTTYGNVFGGGKGLETFAEAGKVKGNTTVEISNGTIKGNVYGGGSYGDVGTITKPADYNYTWKKSDGINANTLHNNTITDNNTNTGICKVTISGGTIGTSGTASDDHGNVFGAGRGLDHTWWCEKAMVFATDVSIKNSGTVVNGNVYGGGQIGRVEDDAKVEIGTLNGSDEPTIVGDVFGAGAGIKTHGYSALVRGNAEVTVQGGAQVGGNVYGGGEIASVGRFTLVKGLPVKPQSGGTCKVTIQDAAKIGSSGTDNDVYGACKGVNPADIAAADRKSMQLYENRPKGDKDVEHTYWDYYEVYPETYTGPKFVWVYYTEDDYPAFLRTLALTSHTDVTIDENADVYGDVYGGGQRGLALGRVDVKIQGGTVHQDVYGGGALADTNSSHWDATNNKLTNYIIVPGLTVGESSVSGYYVLNNGNYEQTSHTTAQEGVDYYEFINYNTIVRLTGGKILRNAYGGGLGDANNPAYVCGDVLVDLNGTTTIPNSPNGEPTTDGTKTTNPTGCIVNQVFGGNNVNGSPKDDVIVHVYATQNKDASKTTIAQKFALDHESLDPEESESDNDYVARLKRILCDRITIAETLSITVSNDDKDLCTDDEASTDAVKTAISGITASINSELNTGTDEQKEAKNALVNGLRYDVKAVYGGGNQAAYDPYSPYTTSNTTGTKTQVIIEGCEETSIETVYGGGNAAAVPETNVEIRSAYEIHYAFGGGNGKSTSTFTNPGADVGIYNESTYGSGNANLTLMGGYIHEVYGGSNEKGNIIGTAKPRTNPSGSCELEFEKMVGAGRNADIDGNVDMILDCMPSKKVPVLYAGADNANVNGYVKLTITNGTFGKVFGGNNEGGAIFGQIRVNVEETGCQPINIDELYTCGNQAAYSVYGYYVKTNEGTGAANETPDLDNDGRLILLPRTSANDSHKAVTSITGTTWTVYEGTQEKPYPDAYTDPVLNIYSCTHIGQAYGGGYGSSATVYGNPTVNINQVYGKKSDGSRNDVLGTIDNVYGGGNEAAVVGSTTVNIGTDKAYFVTEPILLRADPLNPMTPVNGFYEVPSIGSNISGNVYGGGNQADVSENTQVNICAKENALTNAYENVTFGENDPGVTIGGDVFGAGKGVNTDETKALVDGNCIVMMGGGSVKKSVYGGGELSQVGGNTDITISGGTIGTAKADLPAGETAGAIYGNVYGGGFGTSTYGTGTGVATIDNYKLFGLIKGNTNVTISGGDILHNVYGGGAYGSVGEFTYDATTGMPTSRKANTTGGIANVTITGGNIGTTGQENGMVFGSSRGNVEKLGTDGIDPNDRLAWVYNTNVVIGTSGATTGPHIYGSLYGSGENGHTFNNTNVTLHSGTVGVTTASGETNITEGGETYSGAAYPYRGNVFGGGCGTDKYDSNNDNVKDAYNPLAGIVKGNATITITDGTVAHNVYGAGAMGSVGHFEKNATTNAITFTSGGTTTIEISGGTVGVDGSDNGNVFGAARGDKAVTDKGLALVKETSVTISGTTTTTQIKGNVYGGGEIGNVHTNTTVDIQGGAIARNVFGGGKGVEDLFTCEQAMVGVDGEGACEDPDSTANKNKGTSVTISNGTVGTLSNGGVLIEGTGNVYGGGEIGRVEWNTQVTIGESNPSGTTVAPVIYGNVFGAGKGLATHGYSALVRGNSTVTVQGNAKVERNVYGGGEKSTVGRYWVKNISTTTCEGEDQPAAPDVPDGMPYQQRSGGICRVTVQGSAQIGPDAGGSTNAGHVFGAGKGVDLHYNASTSKKKISSNELVGFTATTEKTAEELYFEFLQTLALVTNSYVTIDGSAKVKGSVYGGSESGFVQTSTTVTIQGSCEIGTTSSGTTTYGNIFGGGKGLDYFAEAGKVKGSTNVIINNGTAYGSVYGGGELGDVGTIVKKANDYNYMWTNNPTETYPNYTYNNTGVCNVTINGGIIGTGNPTEPSEHGNVFGAGKGLEDTYWCEKAMVYKTNVIITDGTIKGSVYGGGQVGRVENNATVTIGATTDSGEGSKPDIKGNVFGAGAGLVTHGYSALLRGNTTVTVQGIAKVKGNVYGGGETASVGRFNVRESLPREPLSGGTCKVIIQGNAVVGSDGSGDVYGACKGVTPDYANATEHWMMDGTHPGFNSETDYLDFLKTLALTSNTEVTIGGNATINGSVFGGGQRGIALGGVKVDITGGTVNEDVYGGGALANTNTSHWDAIHNQRLEYVKVYGLTPGVSSVTGYYTMSGDDYIIVKGLNAKARDNIDYYARYTTTVNLTGGYIKGDAYGGGLGQKDGFNGKNEDIAAVVYGDINVNLGSNGGSSATAFQTNYYEDTGYTDVLKSGRVFGCNNLLGSPQGNVTVTVWTTVDGKDAEGNTITKTADKSSTNESDHTYRLAAVYGGGNLAPYEAEGKKAHVIIHGCSDTSILTVYGGGNAAPVPETDVDVFSAYEIGALFGGGNGKDKYTTDEGTTWKINPGANVNGNANTMIYGGTVHEAYGGSNEKGTISGDVTIDVGENAPGETCPLDVAQLVGAGKNADVNGDLKIIMGCKPNEVIPLVFGGADNANVNGNVELTITSGNFTKVFGGNNNGGCIKGHIIVNIEETTCIPLNIEHLYLCGNNAAYSQYGYYVMTEETENGNGNGDPENEHAILSNANKIQLIPRESANDPHLPVYTYSYNETNGEVEVTWTVLPINGENKFGGYAPPELNVISCTSIGEVFGGGYGESATIYGNPTVNINMIPGAHAAEITRNGETGDENALGEIGDVYGGGDAAAVYGNTTVNIGTATTVPVYVFNTNASGEYVLQYETVNGVETPKTTTETVTGAYITGNVFGGGKLADVGKTHLDEDQDGKTIDVIDIEGNTSVNICAKYNESTKKWESVDGLAVTIAGNVFGGGQGEAIRVAPGSTVSGAFRCGKAMVTGGTNVTIGNGTVNGTVYGGGKIGRIEKDTEVTIGIQLAEGETTSTSEPVIEGDVFGAGKGVNTHGYAALVRGNTYVTVQGDAKVRESVYGGGEIASVGRYNIADAAYVQDHPKLEVGMPYSLANNGSGYCTVIVRDNAEIGPEYGMQMKKVDGSGNPLPPDDSGHVFGAGKGILPYEDTDDEDNKPGRVHPTDTWQDYSGENNKTAYLRYIETQGLATQTDVTISGNALVKGSVYGGSMNGHVQHDTHVTIEGDCQIGCGDGVNARYTGWPTETQNITESWKECAHWDYIATDGAPYDPYAKYSKTVDGKVKYYYDVDCTKTAEGGYYIGKDGHTYYGNVFGGGSGIIPYAPGEWHREAGSVGGNTYVNITGGHILTSVYGGNEQTDVGTYKDSNNTIPESGGKCTVNMTGGTLGVPRTVTDMQAHPVTCYLFGAGKGDQRIFFNTWTNVIETEVNISGNARIYGSVFGGGEDGHVICDAETNIGGTVAITKSDGTTEEKTYTNVVIGTKGTSYVDGNVFGGGRGFSGDAQTAGTVGGNVRVNISNGTMLGSVYGGGRLASVGTLFTAPEDNNYGQFVEDVAAQAATYYVEGDDIPDGKNIGDIKTEAVTAKTYGHVTVNISGGTIGNNEGNAVSGNVFGGSMGRLTLLDNTTINPIWPKMAQSKTSAVYISGNNTQIKRNVYGGGEYGTVRENAYVTIGGTRNGDNITASGTPTINGSVYGGGYGSEDSGNPTTVKVYWNDAPAYYTYTPMQWAGCVGGNTTVNILGGLVKQNVYGGGQLASVGIIDYSVKADNDGPFEYEGAKYAYQTVKKHADIDNPGTSSEKVYGFGLSWPYEFKYVPCDPDGFIGGKATVTVENGRIEGYVFGAGKGKAFERYTEAFCANVRETEVNINYSETPSSTGGSTNCIVESVYGGGEDGHVYENSAVNITGGLIGVSVYGGGKGEGKYPGTLYHIVEDAQGNKTADDEYDTDLPSWTAGKVYGNTSVNMTGGHVLVNVYGGGNMGSVGKGNYASGTDDYYPAGYGETLRDKDLWTKTDGFNPDASITESNKPTTMADYFLSSGKCTVNIIGGTIGTSNTVYGTVGGIDQKTPTGMVFGGSRGKAAEDIGRLSPRYAFAPNFFLGYVNKTEVTIGDATHSPTIYSQVFGGGRDGHVRNSSHVIINNGTIGQAYEDYNSISDEAERESQRRNCGNVYASGSGMGTWNGTNHGTSSGSVTRNATVDINGGTIYGNVYGGGAMSSVGPPKIGANAVYAEKDWSKCTVNINGGNIGIGEDYSTYGYGGCVFGASRGGDLTTDEFSEGNLDNYATTLWNEVNIKGGNIAGDVYGGGQAGRVKKDNTVNLTGGTVAHDVFGGGMGTSTIAADVGGDVLVTLNGTATTSEGGTVTYNDNAVVKGSIFGANNVNGTPKGHVTVHVYKTATANHEHGYDVTSVFGGGKQADYVPDATDTKQSTEVIIEGCDLTSIQDVYGGGYGAATPGTNVLIKGTKVIDNVYGGGYGASTDDFNNPGANVGYLTPTGQNETGSSYTLGEGKAVVQLMAGTIHNVYGGSNTKGDIRGGSNVTNVARGSEDVSPNCCTDLNVQEIYGGGKSADMFGGAEIVLGCMPNDWIGAIYAGAESADVGNDVSLTLTSGKFGRVFGGNKSGGTIDGSIEVNIEENPDCDTPIIIGELFGGGNQAAYTVPQKYVNKYKELFGEDAEYPSPRVNVRAFTSIGNIYGGGLGEDATVTGNPTVNINVVEGGKTYNGIGDSGVTTVKDDSDDVVEIRKTLIDGTDETVVTLYPRAATGKMGVIGNVFGGGNAAQVIGNTNVNIGTTDQEPFVSLPLIPVVDNNGNPVYVTDQNGNPVYEVDENGQEVIETDTNGDPVYENDGVTPKKKRLQKKAVQKKNVVGADIRGNIYGGGNKAAVTGDTNVQIGKKAE